MIKLNQAGPPIPDKCQLFAALGVVGQLAHGLELVSRPRAGIDSREVFNQAVHICFIIDPRVIGSIKARAKAKLTRAKMRLLDGA